MVDRFEVPAGPVTQERIIKRSRFITTLDFAFDRQGFSDVLQRQRAALPDARHHCWAYVAGPPGDLCNADKSDDGEPRGTAGKPMLNVLAHAPLGYVAAVVTRYFGGVKLGAGGLVRAYSQCVVDAVDAVSRRTHYITERWTLRMPYALHASVEHALARTDARTTDTMFAEQVTLVLDVPLGETDQLALTLEQLGHGSIERTSNND